MWHLVQYFHWAGNKPGTCTNVSDAILWQIWVNIGLGNGLLTDGTKPLPEPMFTYLHRCSVAFTWEWFYKKCSWITLLELHVLPHLPGVNVLNRKHFVQASNPPVHIPSGVSSSTPTQLPLANSVCPTNWTIPGFEGPWEKRTRTGSPDWIQDGTGASPRRWRSARLPKEHMLIVSSVSGTKRATVKPLM